jgi:hypothetical protein
MTLARRIPIKDRIFTTESLANLLKELSGYYRKSNHEYRENTFHLSISEDEHTTISIDSPPKSFEPLLNSPIEHLRLRINCDSPKRDIEFTISPGLNSRFNCIELQSSDEDWVNVAHTNLSKVLNNVKPQSVFIKRNMLWLIPLFTILIGWPLKKIFYWVLLKLGQAHSASWNWALLGQHLFFAAMLGVLPAMMLLGYAIERAFPGIEFQTGPSHVWKESKMRNQLKILFGLLVLGPLGSFIYDIYKAIIEH